MALRIAHRRIPRLAYSVPRIYGIHFSTSGHFNRDYKLLVVGGGAGGCAIANAFARKLGNNAVAVVEPNEHHHYQALWTLVGAGLKDFNVSQGHTKKVLNKRVDWIQDEAANFQPSQNCVTLASGKEVHYDFLVVAMGLQLDFHKVKGLPEALEHDPMVVSNYDQRYVVKTFPAMKAAQAGNALFTYPNTPVKCAGAAQKVMYLAESHWQKTGRRDDFNIIFNSSLPVIFGIPRYADVLTEVIASRNIAVNFRHNLVEVKPDNREAVFEKLDSPTGETVTLPYSFLHATPPCSAPDPLKGSDLVDQSGFLDVDMFNLQHKKYTNVFGIGDCLNVPTAKTAAAVGAQLGILSRTIKQVMTGHTPDGQYNGYASCPLVTKKNACVLAEFGYDGVILETFPVDQTKERRSMYALKANVMPMIYWNMLVKGRWHGPGTFRTMFNFRKSS